MKSSPDGGTTFKREGNERDPGGPATAQFVQKGSQHDWGQLAERFSGSLDQDRLQKLAEQLDVSGVSLLALEMGWDKKRRAFTFPERDGTGRIIGIAVRRGDGSKSFIKGGKRGLTVPRRLEDHAGPILVVEGPTDVAACHTLGLAAVGRPSNSGGVEHLTDCFADLADLGILVVGENDEKPDGRWPGRDGAVNMARRLASSWSRPVSWTLPPEGYKDVRCWLADRPFDASDDGALQLVGEELLNALKERAVTVSPDACAGAYRASGEGIIYDKPTRDGSTPVVLTNFTARITCQVVRDDGLEKQRSFEIKALVGERLTRFTVSAARFSGMAWVMENLGAEGILYPGYGSQDHVRTAIQLLSGEIATRTVYTHTGWRKIDGRWLYLHGNGAISTHGLVASIETDLPDSLCHFVLPPTPTGEELVEAILASLDLLDLAPDRITIPLLGTVFRSVQGPCDFSLHLVGKTGTFKTELASLAQRYFGVGFDARSLPGSWSSTGNAVEALAFVAKDALMVVDDFAPAGSSQDLARHHREADRVIRAQGNRSGRSRCRPDGTIRHTRAPRGVILSTGEDVPRGHSIQARLLVLELREGDIDSQTLAVAQDWAAKGAYSKTMAGYLKWLAGRIEEVHASEQKRVDDLRRRVTISQCHRRTPNIIANVADGFFNFLRFAVESGAITSDAADDLRERGWSALLEASRMQSTQVSTADPVDRFLELLASSVSSGCAHLATINGEAPDDECAASLGWRSRKDPYRPSAHATWEPIGIRIGWVDGDDMYLDAATAYRVVQSMAGPNGEGIAIGELRLWRSLDDRGILVSSEKGRGTLKVRKQIEGVRRSVLHLRISVLFGTSLVNTDAERISGSDDADVSGRIGRPTRPNREGEGQNNRGDREIDVL